MYFVLAFYTSSLFTLCRKDSIRSNDIVELFTIQVAEIVATSGDIQYAL
jgi:hypothetical protein